MQNSAIPVEPALSYSIRFPDYAHRTTSSAFLFPPSSSCWRSFCGVHGWCSLRAGPGFDRRRGHAAPRSRVKRKQSGGGFAPDPRGRNHFLRWKCGYDGRFARARDAVDSVTEEHYRARATRCLPIIRSPATGTFRSATSFCGQTQLPCRWSRRLRSRRARVTSLSQVPARVREVFRLFAISR
jgi:hypothetical protein